MLKIILTQLSLLIVVSQAQTYLFSEGNGILTICPRIMTSLSVPSFRLEPTSTSREFLNGSYNIYPAEDLPAGIQLNPENGPCDNSDDKMCSKLSLLYQNNQPLGRDSITVTYTASNEAVRMIRINYGFVGIYLEGSSEVVVRVLGRPTTLNDSVLAFGSIPQPLLLCYENGTQEPLADILVVSIPEDTCSSNIAPNGRNAQPGRFKVTVAVEVTGQHRVYIAGSNCTSQTRSSIFDVIFDAPTTTEGPGPITTEPTTSIGPIPTSRELLAIGLGVGIPIFLVIVGVLLVSLLIWYCCYHKKKHQSIELIENGSAVPGNRSKTSSVSTVDVQDGPSGSPTLLISSRNGHVHQKVPSISTKKKLHVVKYKDSKAMSAIEETLAELNEDSYELAVTQQNGILPAYMTNIIEAGHRVVILHGRKESSTESDDISTRWVKELETCPKFTKKGLDNVFVVYLGRTQLPSSVQVIPRLQRIAIFQHPDYEDSNFDPLTVAKLIQKEIVNMSPLNRQQGLPVPPNLSAPPPASSTGSRTPTQSANSTPVIRNPEAGAEHPGEHPLASSAEPSQLFLTIEEDRTVQAVVSDTIETVPGAKLKFLEKIVTNSESSEVKSTASTPAIGRSLGGDALVSTPSAPSVIQVVETGELEDVLNKVVKKAVEAQGKKTRQEMRKVEEEIKNKVEQAEEGIKDKVEQVEEGIKDKVEQAEEVIKDKVQEQGDRLTDSIEVVAEGIEQTRSEMQNQNLDVDLPYDIDNGGREIGDLGSAVSRDDTA